MSEKWEIMNYNIDWARVERIALELQKWISKNNYEIIDIDRAIAHLKELEKEDSKEVKPDEQSWKIIHRSVD